MLRSATDTVDPTTVWMSVVSAVRRDSTSPVRVTSKNSGVRPSTLGEHGLADVGDDALADPGHEIEARRARHAHHGRHRDEGEEILPDERRRLAVEARGRSAGVRRRAGPGLPAEEMIRARPATAIRQRNGRRKARFPAEGEAISPSSGPTRPGRPRLRIPHPTATWPKPSLPDLYRSGTAGAKGPFVPGGLRGGIACPIRRGFKNPGPEGLLP